MNKKFLFGAITSISLTIVLTLCIYATPWQMNNNAPESIPYEPTDQNAGEIDHKSLNYVLFEEYGPLLIVVAFLMFGAMIGGICVAREEIEKREDSYLLEISDLALEKAKAKKEKAVAKGKTKRAQGTKKGKRKSKESSKEVKK